MHQGNGRGEVVYNSLKNITQLTHTLTMLPAVQWPTISFNKHEDSEDITSLMKTFSLANDCTATWGSQRTATS